MHVFEQLSSPQCSINIVHASFSMLGEANGDNITENE